MIQFTEAIRIEGAEAHNMEYHRARANATSLLFFGHTIDLPDISIESQALHKCRILYSDSGILSIETTPYAERSVRSLSIVECPDIEYSHKYADRSAINRLRESTVADDIIIARRGLICDSSASNLVFINDDGAFTPTQPLLRGTMREALLDQGLIKCRDIRVEDIFDYKFVCQISAMLPLQSRRYLPIELCATART